MEPLQRLLDQFAELAVLVLLRQRIVLANVVLRGVDGGLVATLLATAAAALARTLLLALGGVGLGLGLLTALLAAFLASLLASLLTAALGALVLATATAAGSAFLLVLSFLLVLLVTAGVALLLALIPGMMGPFTSDQEAQMFANIQGMTPDVQGMILGSLESMREAMVSADAWRSVVIILVGFACLLLFKMKKIDARILVGLLAVLCLVDLWQVDKRYLNDGMFVPRSERDAPMEPTQADNLILQDKDLDYRVLNFASDTFNENNTSYFHKSIGGYHAAKLRRYQELIEAYIRPEMQAGMQAVAAANGDMTKVDGRKAFPVLNMLNARYFILPLQGGQTMPLRNTYAQGNVWFVDKIRYVDNANEELDGIRAIDVTHEAVADKQFEQALGQAQPLDTTATIKLTAYEANNLQYEVSSKTGGLIVFSEIYYPGWTATVDGQEVAVGRVNYVLRAINVKPGHHKVVLDFHPKSIQTTETIAYTAFAIMMLLIVFAIVVFVRKRRQGDTAQSKD